ncbi:MAG: haloacid dehalogenase-like hydrolase, partial [Bacteroidetes bacterium]|nr:haloacid dehalogenase-like hydrolase [Bacteroidota bacterium]
IKPWALENGLEFVGTRHEVANGVFTGKIDGKNCAGPEKVNRLLEILGNQEIEKSYAYGDTSGDKEMLEWADEGGYRCF